MHKFYVEMAVTGAVMVEVQAETADQAKVCAMDALRAQQDTTPTFLYVREAQAVAAQCVP